jgi:long-chain acyl-CoA synthetase
MGEDGVMTTAVMKIPRHIKYELVHLYHLLDEEPLASQVEVDPRKGLAVLQYTGGTTGTPKWVSITHFNLVVSCMKIDRLYPPTHESQTIIAGVLSFFDAYGMTTVMNYGVMMGV